MAFCGKCGAQLADNATFCSQCGMPHQAGAPTSNIAPSGHSSAAAGSGLSENAAGALSYALGWITGLIFFLIDKRPYVRFHAAQSLVLFGALFVVRIALGMAFGVGMWGGGMGLGGFGAALMLISLFGLACFVLWIFMMVKAGTGSRFKLPIVGDWAEQLAGKQI
jgi:uncharacterized membrane protein